MNKDLVKRRFTSLTIISLIRHYLKDDFLIYENEQIIDSKNQPTYKKIFKFFDTRNINSYGILNINVVYES